MSDVVDDRTGAFAVWWSRDSCNAGLLLGMDAVAGLAMVAGLPEERDGGRLGPDCSALVPGGRRGPCV